MQTSPEQALQKALVAALEGNADFVALAGTGAVYDRLIDRAAFPYVVVAGITTLDWSTATEIGTEHVVTLEAWSRMPGSREVQAIAAVVREALHDKPLPLEAGTLVNLRLEQVRVERLPKQRLHRATMRLRAVVEAD